MKTLKESIKMYESILDIDSNLEKDDTIVAIENWLKKYNIKNYKINDDYTIDVSGNVDIHSNNFEELPSYIRFNYVLGFFTCSHCPNLVSLRGVPKKVDGHFTCAKCDKLTSLEGAPKDVGGSFSCFGCDKLKTLKGAPKEVGQSFDCSYCDSLGSLEDGPKKVRQSFDCSGCKNLISLEGGPKKIGGEFFCYNCPNLKSPEHATKCKRIIFNLP